MYFQLLSAYHTWRICFWICLAWNGLSFAGIAVTYFPHSQTRAKGAAAKQILEQIDYFGGFASIVGLTLFLLAAPGIPHTSYALYSSVSA
jgi:Fungal trichothecene efflux pump (TRI12)